MSNELSESKIIQALDWAYEKSINGFSGLDSAEDLACEYVKNGGNLIDNINSLIRWQNTKAGTSGFIHALNTAARAKGMSEVAKNAGVTRASLYKSLSENGNPRFETIAKIVESFGCKIVLA